MTGAFTYRILGCGSSGGVPRADGAWGACNSSDERNRRSRCSLLVQRDAGNPEADTTTVVIDTSPDFRTQMAASGARRLDAVLYTHDHADQTHGIDDIRVFAGRMRRRIPCFMDEFTGDLLGRRFGYVFEGGMGYPAIAEAKLIPPHGEEWEVDGPSGPVPVRTFEQLHGPIKSVGYRIGGLAYSSDVSDLDEAAFEALAGVRVWIVDALRWTPHPTHADVAKALGWIDRIRPEQAILTNLHVDLDYEALREQLPPGVEPAYDGLTVRLAS
ncbi:MAG: MBL fold metallo-hydrolase [Caulobacteraceae bacterium]|nr:MBL fold metallo-hydrolase [Caulobacteraceae bacterium]